MLDEKKRKVDYLRISVTDQCNLRCFYCMPEDIAGSDISYMSFEEITEVCEAAAGLGVNKIKITGGEPLMRKGLSKLIRRIRKIEGISSVTLTTNGILLNKMCRELREAGLSGVNISFDTRIPERYRHITRRDCYDEAFKGFLAALSCGIPTKINSVIVKNINQDEIDSIAAIAKEYPVDVRFIELMPLGCAQVKQGVSEGEIMNELEKKYGKLIPNTSVHGNGPAKYFDVRGFQGSIGFISALSHGFCGDCNRIRLTCEGMLKPCLHYEDAYDLRRYLGKHVSKEGLMRVIEEAVMHKPESHQFEKPGDNKEKKLMSQLGG